MSCLSRRNATVVCACALLGFALVAVLIALDSVSGLDLAARHAASAYQSVLLTDVAFLFTQLGYAQGLVPVAALAVLLMAWRRRFSQAVLPVLVLASVELLNKSMKEVFVRQRPDFDPSAFSFGGLDRYSFPSGHAMDSMALYFLLACWALAFLAGRVRFLLATVLLLMPLLIGLSRVVLGVHWLTDVIGGWFAGVAVAGLVLSLWPQPAMQGDAGLHAAERRSRPRT